MAHYETFFTHNWALLQQAALYHPRPNPTFANPAFAAAPFRALILRLSPFRDVDRSTPHLFLFQAVRRAVPGAYVDMAFFPPEHDRARFEAAGVPLIVGTQSWRGLEDFDAVLVSNAYTLELINLPYLLQRSGVPVMADQRDATFPPLILGGSNALATQAIINEAGDCVADALFCGEGERQVAALTRALHAGAALPKRERLLRAAAEVDGLWVAGVPGQRVTKALCREPSAADLLVDYPLLDSAEAGTARLQIGFGCPAFCSFCFEGYDRKPYREIAPEAALATAQTLKAAHGAAEVDLYSFNFNTYRDILTLLLELHRRFDRVGMKSQRVDVLARAPLLVEAEALADKRSFTLGIEGVSQGMRAFLHKSLSDAEIETALRRLLRQKPRELKLFFILTGHETAADIAEFRAFVGALKALHRQHHRGARVMFSFGYLIRMPFTPLRHDWLRLDEADWRAIAGPVKSAVETHGFEFRLATPWDEYAASQVLALGGYWLAEAVLALAEAGHCYDLTLTPGYWDALRGWMVERGHWSDAFLGAKGPDYAFPLEFVTQPVGADFLYQQYQEAQAGHDPGYCLSEVGQAGATAHCLGCGACSTPAERAAIVEHRLRHPGAGYLRELEDVIRTKWRLPPLYARMWLPPAVAGRDPAWIEAWVLRSLLATFPALADTLLAARESLWTTKANRRQFGYWHGETVIALKAWDADALVCLEDATVTPIRKKLTHHGDTENTESLELSQCPQCLSGLELANGARFLGWTPPDFEPGQFRQAEMALRLPSVHFPAAGDALRRFLHAAYVPVNARREEVGFRFDIPEKARKKRVLLAGDYRRDATHFAARLVVTPKFDLLGYLRSFAGASREREAMIEWRDLKVV